MAAPAPPAPPPPPDPVAAARELVHADRQRRADACREELAQVLARHRCDLSPQILVSPGVPTELRVAVVPLD